MGQTIRLDKYLTDMGKGTRSQVKDAAKNGRVRVNGVVEKKTDRKIDPETEEVSLDSCVVNYQFMEYYMLNKPQGVVSAVRDNLHTTVIDLLDMEKRNDLFPVGRLDLDTEGLLLITNDGDLAHCLLAPKKHVDKQYYARISGHLPENAADRMAEGMTLADDTTVRPAKLEVIRRLEQESEIRLTIHEGKFHQVKRMFEALGCRVDYLKRISMGSLVLDDSLKPGEYRAVTKEELGQLRKGE